MSRPAFTATERAEVLEEYPRFIPRPAAARLLGVSDRTLGRSIDAGQLNLYRIGATRTPRLKTQEVLKLVRVG